ncbi:MAG: hypothetical protein QM679_08240 [Patulibacter sp.]
MAPVNPQSFKVDVLTEPRTLWMLVSASSVPDDERDRERLFHSRFALDESPHPFARRATVLYMALSMWDESGFAHLRGLVALNASTPRFVARVALKPKVKSHATGICIADTAEHGHWSVWGTPAKLGHCLVDIQPVGTLP